MKLDDINSINMKVLSDEVTIAGSAFSSHIKIDKLNKTVSVQNGMWWDFLFSPRADRKFSLSFDDVDSIVVKQKSASPRFVYEVLFKLINGSEMQISASKHFDNISFFEIGCTRLQTEDGWRFPEKLEYTNRFENVSAENLAHVIARNINCEINDVSLCK